MRFLIFTALVFCFLFVRSQTLIPFRTGDKWGYCDNQQKIIVPCKYDDVNPFSYGFGAVKDDQGMWHTVSAEGKVGKGIKAADMYGVAPHLWIVIRDGKYGLVNAKGKNLSKNLYDEFIRFYDGSTATWVKRNGKYGVMNTKGVEVIPAEYKGVSGPSNGTFAVNKEGLYAIFDANGTKRTEFIYSQVNLLSEDKFVVKEEKTWKILDKNLKEILNLGNKYDFVGGFKGGLARVSQKGKWGFINAEGKEILPVQYARTGSLGEGLFCYSNGNQDIIIDNKGNIVRKDIASVSAFVNHRAIITQEGSVGMIAPDGKTVIDTQYDAVEDFFIGNMTIATKGDAKYIIDKNGTVLHETSFEDISADEGGLFLVMQDGKKIGYIDAQGTQYWKD